MTQSAATEGLTDELARLAVGWTHPRPDEALDLAQRAVVDTVAVTLAAAADPTVTALFEALAPDLTGGPASAWVRNVRGDARSVALVNGACAHALDFDDVDEQMIGHPSAVLVPAVLAVGEEVGAGGREVLEAYWVGLAVCRALAAALNIESHYRAGWHSTGTVGAVGAAAAGARLRGLSVDKTRHALGIAGSLAAGSRQNFGTMTKPLHAGVAASNGVLATKLAVTGYTADTSQLESPLGYLALHDAAPGHRRVEPSLMAEPGLNVKLHACCYYIHAAADAMLDLVANGLRAEEVERIAVTGPPDGFGPLIHHRPQTGLQGKFSMEYAMAAAVLDGSLGLSSFTDEAVTRPQARDLVERVELVPEQTPPVGPEAWQWTYAVVRVECTDGRTLTKRVDQPRGQATKPLDEADLRRKFDECIEHGGFVGGDKLYSCLRNLRGLEDVREVTDRLAELVRRDGGQA
jgi:2-methylcitrate dehydratase PrpD